MGTDQIFVEVETVRGVMTDIDIARAVELLQLAVESLQRVTVDFMNRHDESLAVLLKDLASYPLRDRVLGVEKTV